MKKKSKKQNKSVKSYSGHSLFFLNRLLIQVTLIYTSVLISKTNQGVINLCIPFISQWSHAHTWSPEKFTFLESKGGGILDICWRCNKILIYAIHQCPNEQHFISQEVLIKKDNPTYDYLFLKTFNIMLIL